MTETEGPVESNLDECSSLGCNFWIWISCLGLHVLGVSDAIVPENHARLWHKNGEYQTISCTKSLNYFDISTLELLAMKKFPKRPLAPATQKFYGEKTAWKKWKNRLKVPDVMVELACHNCFMGSQRVYSIVELSLLSLSSFFFCCAIPLFPLTFRLSFFFLALTFPLLFCFLFSFYFCFSLSPLSATNNV